MSSRPTPSPTDSNTRSAHLADTNGHVRLITVIVRIVIGLTFLFGLGIRLGAPAYVAIFVAPEADLSTRNTAGG